MADLNRMKECRRTASVANVGSSRDTAADPSEARS